MPGAWAHSCGLRGQGELEKPSVSWGQTSVLISPEPGVGRGWGEEVSSFLLESPEVLIPQVSHFDFIPNQARVLAA